MLAIGAVVAAAAVLIGSGWLELRAQRRENARLLTELGATAVQLEAASRIAGENAQALARKTLAEYGQHALPPLARAMGTVERDKTADVLAVLLWTEKHWGDFPTYYLESPYCTPEAARWLIEKGVRAVGFDCFSEYCARLPDFTSDDFIIHKIILENGALLMQQMTNLSHLPKGKRFKFFAPFIKLGGAEGSPARFFALLD